MGERVRDDITLRLPLQAIVSNRGRSLHRCLNVAWLNKLPFLLGTVCPHAGEAVGLEFDPDLQAIGLHLVHPTLFLLPIDIPVPLIFPERFFTRRSPPPTPRPAPKCDRVVSIDGTLFDATESDA